MAKRGFIIINLLVLLMLIVLNVGCIENNEETDKTVLTVIYGDYNNDYTLDDLEFIESYTGKGRFITKTGKISNSSLFTGVRISEILDEIPNLPNNYNISVIASDGYEVIYTMDDIDGNIDIYDEEGNILSNETAVMILAYKEDGEYYSLIDPDGETGPLRVAFVGNNVITSSNIWLRMVVSIEVI